MFNLLFFPFCCLYTSSFCKSLIQLILFLFKQQPNKILKFTREMFTNPWRRPKLDFLVDKKFFVEIYFNLFVYKSIH